ncbi:MAG: glutathione S- transferase, nitrogen catabolite repression regulator [Bathelium mastoideum]|nr:MAG: glutathione S- transferase, nitrogen catabolite repression regulator [Bathelium mastoideum]KAI9693194.1 MAG: glutathione S- transferase, nitrogen catabolite repression regulator [Bathelium mastoideum]
MSLKPITLYSHASGPNPWRVAIILEELGLPYENKFLEFGDMKKEPYTLVNPNGRVPAIEDPNTGFKLFESGAIVEYLVEKYDKNNKLTYTSEPEKYLTKSWAFFQISGQGPYFGQKAWFTHFHPEKIASAIDRYANEIKRVTSVIDSHLSKSGKQWLVGDQITYADLAFVPWQQAVPFLLGEEAGKLEEDYPHYAAWNKRLNERESVKKVTADKMKAMGH